MGAAYRHGRCIVDNSALHWEVQRTQLNCPFECEYEAQHLAQLQDHLASEHLPPVAPKLHFDASNASTTGSNHLSEQLLANWRRRRQARDSRGGGAQVKEKETDGERGGTRNGGGGGPDQPSGHGQGQGSKSSRVVGQPQSKQASESIDQSSAQAYAGQQRPWALLHRRVHRQCRGRGLFPRWPSRRRLTAR